MKVLLYGTTGKAGSRILAELLDRGHDVVAVLRRPEKLSARHGLTIQTGDLSSVDAIARAIDGARAVVSAARPPQSAEALIEVMERQIAAVQQVSRQFSSPEHAPRLIVVGGAGSLEVAPGVTLVSAPNFPPEWKAIALAHEKVLELLRASSHRLDLPKPVCTFRAGRADWHLPPRPGHAADRGRWQELDFDGGLRHRAGR